MREKVRIRKNKIVEEVKCFRYQGVGYFKWECSNIKVEKKKKRDEKVACIASPQKVQQGERLVYSLQRKIQEYSGIQRIPPRSTALEQKEQTTRWEVVTFVECGEYNYKGTKMYENQGQGFISGEHLRNVWCSSCLEIQRWRENTARERRAVNVKYSQYRRKDIVERISEKDRKRILCLEYRTGRKQPWWD